MYYMEMILGQFSSQSSVKIYAFSPVFKVTIRMNEQMFFLNALYYITGIGIGQLLSTICIITYYTSLIALTLYYMFASFSSELPWARCVESWGADCVDTITKSVVHSNESLAQQTKATSSSEYYFLYVYNSLLFCY